MKADLNHLATSTHRVDAGVERYFKPDAFEGDINADIVFRQVTRNVASLGLPGIDDNNGRVDPLYDLAPVRIRL